MDFSSSNSSRPYSGYEELDLDSDEAGVSTVDPWRSTSITTTPPSISTSTSRFPTQSPTSNLSTPGASSSRLPSPRVKSLDSPSKTIAMNSIADVPVVLGVAVVDFNHLVSTCVHLSRTFPNLRRSADDDLNRSVRLSNSRVHRLCIMLFRMTSPFPDYYPSSLFPTAHI